MNVAAHTPAAHLPTSNGRTTVARTMGDVMRRMEAHFLQPGDVIELVGRPFAVRTKLLEGSRVVADIEHLGGDHDGAIVQADWHWDEPVRRLRSRPREQAIEVDDGLGL